MATPINSPLTSEIWHLSIDDLLQPLPESPRLGGSGPFVINLSASTAPISQPTKSLAECASAYVYQIQRTEDRRLRYRLRLGPFATEDEADAVLSKVRDIYPSALTATAEMDDLRAIGTLQAKVEAQAAAKLSKAAAAKAPSSFNASIPVLRSVASASPPPSVPAATAVRSVAATSPMVEKPASRPAVPAGVAVPPSTAAQPGADRPSAAQPIAAHPIAARPIAPAQAATVDGTHFVPPASATPAPVAAVAWVPPTLSLLSEPTAKPQQEPADVSTSFEETVPALTAKVLQMPKPAPRAPAPAVIHAASISITHAGVIPVLSDSVEVVRRPAARSVTPIAPQAPPAVEPPVIDAKVAPPPAAAAAAVTAAPLATPAALAPAPAPPAAAAPIAKAPTLATAPKAALPLVQRKFGSGLRRFQEIAPPAPLSAPVRPALVPKPPTSAAKAVAAAKAAPGTDAPKPAPMSTPPSAAAPPVAPPSLVAPAAPATPAALRAEPLETPLASIESTQTLRPLTSLELQEDGSVSRWFVIQLSVAEEAFDPDSLPNLDIFSEYRLYCVAGIDQGKVMHALRVGFFTEEGAAAAVASYLGAFYDKPTIKRISAAERERFAHQRVEARKDIGATGRHAVIEITNERVIREKRTTPVTPSAAAPATSPQAARKAP